MSKDIVEGVTYKLFIVALLYIDDIEDDDIGHLEPKEQVTKKKIREFFESCAQGVGGLPVYSYQTDGKAKCLLYFFFH